MNTARRREAMSLLVEGYEYPVAAAAGIVGNLEAESGIIPDRVEGSRAETPRTSKGFNGVWMHWTPAQIIGRSRKAGIGPALPGIGLAQWTHAVRRNGLFTHRYRGEVLGERILDSTPAQIDYLVTELRRDFRRLEKVLTSPAVTVEQAASEFVYDFERPGSILGEDEAGKSIRLARDHANVQAVFAKRTVLARLALAAWSPDA